MKHSRTYLCLSAICAGCVGTIGDPAELPRGDDAGVVSTAARSGSSAGGRGGAPSTVAVMRPTAPTDAGTTIPNTTIGFDPNALSASGESVGVGDMLKPALGPAPLRAQEVGGAPFVLVKNWDFGSDGTMKSMDAVIAEFHFHDHFNTIANGTNYGSVTVAPNVATAISAPDLGLPNNRQPIEDPARPYRELTETSIKAYVRPLSAASTRVSAAAHDTGNGSFSAKWSLPRGGSRLQKDLLWESRVRIPKPAPGFWFSLWTAGREWRNGAEMDVVESFGTPNIGSGAKAFHVNSVGGRDKHAFDSWPTELTNLGVPQAARDLSEWHVFTWVYLKDDTYKVYFDDYLVQQGTLLWTLSGTPTAKPIDMFFLFDFSWGHTTVDQVNISLPASSFPITYELDYSRVYLRE